MPPPADQSRLNETGPRWKPIDLFFLLNTLFFAALAVFRYYHRFIDYHGRENVHEFFIYAAVLLLCIALLWRAFRHHRFPGFLLPLVEAGILIHFMGAFVRVDGGRLYEAYLLGVRYDKIVHFTNAFIACVFLRHLFSTCHFPLTRLGVFFIVLSVMGLGAFIEIIEYGVYKTVPQNGVGDYDNNLQDLCANLTGCLAFALSFWMARRAGNPARGIGNREGAGD